VAATAVAFAAVGVGGLAGPALLIGIGVVAPALAAGLLWKVVRTAGLMSLPLGISALLVNLFLYPGATDALFSIGPLTATVEGLRFASEILLRILAITGAITLFYLTTAPSALVIDLERRGISSRVAFVVLASVETVPAMVERAIVITAAQRARGLDTEGSVVRRIRGVVPLAGPVLLGSIAEVEERSTALESRGFTHPGRRTLLWWPADSGRQAVARWSMVVAVPLLVVARAVGWLGWLG